MSGLFNLLPEILGNGLVAKVTEIPRLWYSIPLIIAISLVYGATRHEHLKEIAVHSFKSLLWVVGFMGIIFAIIYVSGYWN